MARFRAYDSESEDDAQQSDSSKPLQTGNGPPPNVSKPTPRRASYASSSASSSSLSPESIEDDAEDSEEDSIMDEDELRPTLDHNHEVDENDVPRPWPQQLDLEPHRVHVMQTSLFRVPELAKDAHKEPTPFLKHRRSTDTHVETKTGPPRTSFAAPRSNPPARKYARVAPTASIALGHENIYLDAGLGLGYSFRAGWGPKHTLGIVSGLGASSSTSENSSQSLVAIRTPPLPPSTSADLLQQLLSNSSIEPPSAENNGTPIAIPNRDLNFSSFLQLFPPTDGSHNALVFRLAHALFDPIDLHIGKSVSADIRNRVAALRRAEALSSWLSKAVSNSVDADLRAHAASDSCYIAFLHMTGNQVEKAVETLSNSGNVRLATIISQVPGDIDFRVDIKEQLQIWREEKADIHIKDEIRKLYALASGDVNFLDESNRREKVNMFEGLDWLRVFGLQLWFSSMLDTPLRETFEAYEQMTKDYPGQFACPVPWYSNANSNSFPSVPDGLYNVMKLALSPSTSLESALNPRSFSSNPCDYKTPWLLYIILSQCLRLRDFTDRQLQDAVMDGSSDSSQESSGYSQTANALTLSFASQLEQEGLIQEAAFVLLFLEDDLGRKRAIKELLGRSAPLLDDWNVAGLQGSLKIPREWIDESRATYALYNGDIYLSYELFTSAKEHRAAHELAITYLAPEAILCDDLDLLSNLFTVLDENLVEDFGVGGQLFIDYVNIVSRVPELRENLQTEEAIPDASEASELELLTGRIPRLIGILPDVLRDRPGTGERCKAALSHILSKLLDCLDPTRPIRVDIESGLVDEEARLRHINTSACASFLRTIETMS